MLFTEYHSKDMDESNLPIEILLRIFEYMDPKDRISVLQTNKEIKNTCLLNIWKPWSKCGKGLAYSIINGHIGYFRRWRALAPEEEILTMIKCTNFFALAASHGYLDFIKMFLRDPVILDAQSFSLDLAEGLEAAINFRKIKIIRYFIHFTDISLKWIERIFCQLCKMDSPLVKIFLEREDISSELINECFLKACARDNLVTVKQLLDDGRTNPNQKAIKPILLLASSSRLLDLLLLDWRYAHRDEPR